MISSDSGPLDIIMHTYNIVNWLSERKNKVISYIFSSFRDGILCMRCNSVWFGFIYSLLISDNIIQLVLFTFLFSATTILIEDIRDRLNYVEKKYG